jgi:large subunit ribosomal protein L4
MAATTYTKTGTKATTQLKLNNAVFGVKDINQQLLHQAYTAYLANGRINLATTKTRGLVSGSNKKPWRQKGTGRARVGSKRTPVWRGGGIVFGPTGEENYTKKLNLKAKQEAIRQALSAANKAGIIKVVEDFSLKQPKTKDIAKFLDKIDVNGYVLFVTDHITNELGKSFANLANVKLIQAKYLNVARIMDADTIVITKAALDSINDWLVKVQGVAK